MISFHIARHTFCVLLLTKDVPIYTVQKLMCHSDINSTSVYADLLNKTKEKAVRKLPLLNGSKTPCNYFFFIAIDISTLTVRMPRMTAREARVGMCQPRNSPPIILMPMKQSSAPRP